jgi:cytochrome c peroxidase
MLRAMSSRLFLALICGSLVLAAAPPLAAEAGRSRAAVYREAQALTAIGRQLFFDPGFSASGKLACASCHDPRHAFGPPNPLPVQPGGADLTPSGVRSAPSLRYLQATPHFTEHFFASDNDGDESIDNGPTGGLTWDGRADRGRDQARLPLLSPSEMANPDAAAVVARMRRAGYGDAFARIYGRGALADGDAAFAAVLRALEAFEQDAASFYPYSSKYDDFLAGKAALSAAEMRGLAVFDDPAKGNCARCHVSRRGNDGTPPQFTDYGLIALGVPRNPAIPANADRGYYDLGLCGPIRSDLAGRPEYCGLFKTPTLRNVAVKQSFFHNGVFRSLRQVIEFYVERDTDPGRWYPRRADGSIDKYDDLPAAYRANVNIEPPFDRLPGDKPALDDAEIDDIVAFLGTLTDADLRR